LTYAGYGFLPTLPIPGIYWHAHEMIYGFCAAIIAGFLLTAVPNWTGQPYFDGKGLATLFSLWVGARIAFFFGSDGLLAAMVLDTLFYSVLLLVLYKPIALSKQWKQGAVLGKVLFLLVGSSAFYLGALGVYSKGYFLGIYLGFYVVVGLILTILRRILPSFIEAAAKSNVELRRSVFLDRCSIFLYVLFLLALFVDFSAGWYKLLALPLALVHLTRLLHWYHRSAWANVLVWTLLLAYSFFPLGFLLLFLSYFLLLDELLALHTFAFGGMGFVIMSMMCRVTLGHGGGKVFRPPSGTLIIFVFLALGFLFRVLIPLVRADIYMVALFAAATCWAVSFFLYLFLYRMFLLPVMFQREVSKNERT
jgi:uncharacterized protein involved in response to NO